VAAIQFNVACIQNCADDALDENNQNCLVLARDAHAAGANLICLPEYFSCVQEHDWLVVEHARAEEAHPAVPLFASMARELGVWVLLGSIPVEAGKKHVHNRSLLLDDKGRIVSRYDKIHLFDVELKEGEVYRESATVAPGKEAIVAKTPWGKIGMSICYDVRFPHLYQTLARRGAEFISVPSNFTRTTGKAHWHTLLRARAIETGCFIFAPAQCGVRRWGRATYGHSLIVGPWGEVLADAGDDCGYIMAEIDPSKVAEARRMIPTLEHDRQIHDHASMWV